MDYQHFTVSGSSHQLPDHFIIFPPHQGFPRYLLFVVASYEQGQRPFTAQFGGPTAGGGRCPHPPRAGHNLAPGGDEAQVALQDALAAVLQLAPVAEHLPVGRVPRLLTLGLKDAPIPKRLCSFVELSAGESTFEKLLLKGEG